MNGEVLFTVYRHLALAGAYGMLWLRDQAPIAVTLERTYEDLGVPHTKIPDGIHRCRRSYYNRGHYDTWEILIPGHTAILFHKLNKELESEGCVGLGKRFHNFSTNAGVFLPGIANSAEAFNEFMLHTQGFDEFKVQFLSV